MKDEVRGKNEEIVRRTRRQVRRCESGYPVFHLAIDFGLRSAIVATGLVPHIGRERALARGPGRYGMQKRASFHLALQKNNEEQLDGQIRHSSEQKTGKKHSRRLLELREGAESSGTIIQNTCASVKIKVCARMCVLVRPRISTTMFGREKGIEERN
jgi:hypothetical protein